MATLGFKPTEYMMRTKALYWGKVKEMPGETKCTLTQALNITNDDRLSEWWRDPEFVNWFGEEDTWKIEMEVLCMKLPFYLQQILDNEDPKAIPAKVQVAKLLAETTNKMPAKTKEIRYADAFINNMDKEQLKEFISKTTKQLKAVR